MPLSHQFCPTAGVVSTTGALTGSPFFLAVSTALPLSWVSAVVWPCLSVFTVPVEPSAALVSVTELPLGLVVVLEVLPSLAVVVSTLVPSGLVVVVVSVFPLLEEGLLEPPPPPPPEEEPPPVEAVLVFRGGRLDGCACSEMRCIFNRHSI